MKPLPQFVEDMKATADLLREQADHLDELVQFFGGGLKVPTSPPAKMPPPPPKPLPVIIPVEPPVAAAPPAEEPPPEKKRKRGGRPGRMLTKAEKKDILEDWNAIPPQLRTKTNRAALSAKYNCSPIQVFAITRDPVELKKHLLGGRAAAKALNGHPLPQHENQSKTHGVQ